MSQRLCATRGWKNAHGRSAVPTSGSPSAPPQAPAVFQGTVFLAPLKLDGPGGPWQLSPADVATVLSYLESAAAPVAAYAMQYGPVRLAVSPKVLELTAQVAKPEYSDQDLQTWVNGVAIRGSLPADSAVMVLNPPGVVNRDAKETGGVGVLGYHGLARLPYGFVNALGSGFTAEDAQDLYAEALSHELAELVVDPRADGSQPEVCDGCGTNCQGAAAYRCYFDENGAFLGAGPTFPPPFSYAFFVSSIARPASVTDCPAPADACAYPPP